MTAAGRPARAGVGRRRSDALDRDAPWPAGPGGRPLTSATGDRRGSGALQRGRLADLGDELVDVAPRLLVEVQTPQLARTASCSSSDADRPRPFTASYSSSGRYTCILGTRPTIRISAAASRQPPAGGRRPARRRWLSETFPTTVGSRSPATRNPRVTDSLRVPVPSTSQGTSRPSASVVSDGDDGGNTNRSGSRRPTVSARRPSRRTSSPGYSCTRVMSRCPRPRSHSASASSRSITARSAPARSSARRGATRTRSSRRVRRKRLGRRPSVVARVGGRPQRLTRRARAGRGRRGGARRPRGRGAGDEGGTSPPRRDRDARAPLPHGRGAARRSPPPSWRPSTTQPARAPLVPADEGHPPNYSRTACTSQMGRGSVVTVRNGASIVPRSTMPPRVASHVAVQRWVTVTTFALSM